jgi:hypothetical protein
MRTFTYPNRTRHAFTLTSEQIEALREGKPVKTACLKTRERGTIFPPGCENHRDYPNLAGC